MCVQVGRGCQRRLESSVRLVDRVADVNVCDFVVDGAGEAFVNVSLALLERVACEEPLRYFPLDVELCLLQLVRQVCDRLGDFLRAVHPKLVSLALAPCDIFLRFVDRISDSFPFEAEPFLVVVKRTFREACGRLTPQKYFFL